MTCTENWFCWHFANVPFALVQLLVYMGIFCSVSCRSSHEREMLRFLKENLGKKIFFPDTIYAINYESDTILLTKSHLEKNNKIITFIHGDCDLCIYDIPEWNEFINQIPTESNVIGLVYILNISPEGFLLNNHALSLNDRLLFVFDSDYWMHKHNEIPSGNQMSTFFLDTSNRIQLMGNPVKNDNIRQLYIRCTR